MTRYSVTGRHWLRAHPDPGAGCALTAPAAAQVAGIPALSINEGADGSTYSLSLQILALMTALTLSAVACSRHDILHQDHHRSLHSPSGDGNAANAAKPGSGGNRPVPDFLHHGADLTTLNSDVISPYLDGQLPAETALANGTEVMKRFLVQNTRVNDLVMFTEMIGDQPYASAEDVPLSVLLPAFITSELKTAFQIGFLLFLPFLVIDMVIASILMSLGMMMLSPMLVALPFKLLLFVLVDGWAMTVGSLVATYSVA